MTMRRSCCDEDERRTRPDERQNHRIDEQENGNHLNRIISKIFIGDFMASQSIQSLLDNRLLNVVSAMKQAVDYSDQIGFRHLRVPIDDSDRTNIIEWFDVVGNWIQAKIDEKDDRNVLVHCAAGVSRSTTLVAAYLMKAYNLTTEEAIEFITSKRPQVQPSEFFIHQLEMYERCNFEWDPVKYQEQRRFLMGFMADKMKDGNGADKLVLAYYPSPAPSPRDGTNRDPMTRLAMTPLTIESKLKSTNSLISPSIPLSTIPPTFNSNDLIQEVTPRRRFTKRRTSPDSQTLLTIDQSNNSKSTKTNRSNTSSIEKLGQGRVVIRGRRLRCKLCRRELAARDHVLSHSPGHGQLAFSNQRRDMKSFRERVARAADNSGRDLSIEQLPTSTGKTDESDIRTKRAETRMFEKSGIGDDDVGNDQRLMKGGVTGLEGKGDRPMRGLASLRISLPPSALEALEPRRRHDDQLRASDRLPLSLEEEVVEEGQETKKGADCQLTVSPPLNDEEECSSYFVEPLSWMSGVLGEGQMVGKLICPNLRCQSKLGCFDWAGCRCSCGAWITPGFQILKSKVDEM
ncbi:hypothetical protein BY996DRAFT_6693017 [Phakopsora pachyrhizi]|uniref:protein-tyrosine-phosphatase n=1 Tax=Phakopsora pachyrhizi TaxID=170000 RepID=A0AAV0B8J3_PHAPC|nr:hypothetical protein BY996DRAFT_6693017 [Phakopsora pachyrhizi]CAH7682786.1 hypothetical protein PPACK8108_LOCUS15889 [Phakopsora pachyrhizi]